MSVLPYSHPPGQGIILQGCVNVPFTAHLGAPSCHPLPLPVYHKLPASLPLFAQTILISISNIWMS